MPQPINITIENPDTRGRHVVVVQRGDRQHRDRFDLNDAYRRAKFLDRVMRQLVDPSEDPERLLEEIDGRLQASAAELLNESQPLQPVVLRLDEVKSESVQWLWPGFLARGKLTMVAGDPGLGKSLVTLDLAARVTRGDPWPDGSAATLPPSSVLLLSAEDDPADTLAPRLKAANADLLRVHALVAAEQHDDQGNSHQHTFSLTTMMPLLEQALQQRPNCRLLVVDPITAYLQGIDSHRNAEVRSLLAPLSDLAARYDVAVIAVTHLNKSSAGPAIYRSMGSLAFAAAARAVWAVVKQGDRRLLLPVKNNIGQDRCGLAYEVVSSDPFDEYSPPQVVWEEKPVQLNADEAMRQAAFDSPATHPSARQAARSWLLEQLSSGARPSKPLLQQAATAGHATQTVRRAFAELQGKAYQREGSWHWELTNQSA